MPHLFSPLTIGNITFKNRLVVSPMCQYSALDGFANDWHFVHLATRAVGGAGLVFTEAAAVAPEGRISAQDLGIWQDEHIEELKRITDFMHQHEALAGIQLAHAGHKASSGVPWKGGRLVLPENDGWQPVSASAYPLAADNPLFSNALTTDEIKTIVGDFVKAAQRALSAGFDVIEIHAAHGYLLNGFLSPVVNRRSDEYGGSFENRIRLLLEITNATRAALPENYPLFIRISASDWTENGWTIDDSVALSAILKNHGVDLIDCSSGGLTKPSNIPVGFNYQVPFAQKIKQQTGILTGAVGLITEAQQANAIIVEEKADLVFLGREMLRDSYFPQKAAFELGQEIKIPVQYERAKRH